MNEKTLEPCDFVGARVRTTTPGAWLGVCLILSYTALGGYAYRTLGDSTYTLRLLQPQFFMAVPAAMMLSLPIVLMGLRRRLRDASGRPIRDALVAWPLAWRALDGARVRYVTVVSLLSALFLNAFIAWKTLIPRLHPFAFDAELARWEVALHAGAPLRLVAWVPVSLLDPVYYYGWTLGLMAGLLALAWSRDTRALLALALAWIVLGTITAIAVSSAGPPFFTQVTGLPSPYLPLFAQLATAEHGQPAFALEVQRSLWSVYRSGAIVSGTGISAFPSMHVATAMIFTVASRRRWLRCAVGLYTIVIFVGSVALGWHYVLDGYAAIIGAVLVWWVSGQIVSEAKAGHPFPSATGRGYAREYAPTTRGGARMLLNMDSPIVRASFGMFFGTAMLMALRLLPGLDYLNIFHGIGAGGFGGAAMVAMGGVGHMTHDLAAS